MLLFKLSHVRLIHGMTRSLVRYSMNPLQYHTFRDQSEQETVIHCVDPAVLLAVTKCRNRQLSVILESHLAHGRNVSAPLCRRQACPTGVVDCGTCVESLYAVIVIRLLGATTVLVLSGRNVIKAVSSCDTCLQSYCSLCMGFYNCSICSRKSCRGHLHGCSCTMKNALIDNHEKETVKTSLSFTFIEYSKILVPRFYIGFL